MSGTTTAKASAKTRAKQRAEAYFPTRWGDFRILGYELQGYESEHSRSRERLTAKSAGAAESAVALVMGDIITAERAKAARSGEPDRANAPLVRIHSQCLTGDVFGSLRCDCRQQLEMALEMIAREGAGILIYEQQEGRGIGLMAKLQAYELQDQGLDTVEANEKLGFKADHREFELPAAILRAMGVSRVRLLSNNPEKVAALERAGIRVVERVACEVEPHAQAENYIKTKKAKLGHLFTAR